MSTSLLGERLAIVGPSGSGKSTLGRLLAGIHPPRTGRVDVGGASLIELPLENLHREVALVTQEHHIFRGSLRDNVVLAPLLLAAPHTLVLDEATSLIDPATERNVETTMSALTAGRTIVAIAHRLHTAHDADRIAVIAEGRSIELGPRGAPRRGWALREPVAGVDRLDDLGWPSVYDFIDPAQDLPDRRDCRDGHVGASHPRDDRQVHP